MIKIIAKNKVYLLGLFSPLCRISEKRTKNLLPRGVSYTFMVFFPPTRLGKTIWDIILKKKLGEFYFFLFPIQFSELLKILFFEVSHFTMMPRKISLLKKLRNLEAI